jgi:hypothetical protein
MAKRKTSSRGSVRKSPKAARSLGARPASDPALEQVISAEAVYELAASNPAGTAGDVARIVAGHVAAPDQEPTRVERERHAEDIFKEYIFYVELSRDLMINSDQDEKPFVRIVGRIMYILTVDGKKDSCTTMPITVAFLLFLPEHLDPEHRQPGKTRDMINVTEPKLQGLLYDRLNRLTDKRMKLAQQIPAGRGYQLTERGRRVFRDWPDGIILDPLKKELWTRRSPAVRGKKSLKPP